MGAQAQAEADFLWTRRMLHQAMGRDEEPLNEKNTWVQGRMTQAVYEYLREAPLGPEILAPGAPKPQPYHKAIEYRYPFHRIPSDPQKLYDRAIVLQDRISHVDSIRDSSSFSALQDMDYRL